MMRSFARVLALISCFLYGFGASAQTVPGGPEPLTVTGPFGTLSLRSLNGDDAISAPFRYELELDTAQSIAFDAILGQPLTVTLRGTGGVTRQFSGICSRISESFENGQP